MGLFDSLFGSEQSTESMATSSPWDPAEGGLEYLAELISGQVESPLYQTQGQLAAIDSLYGGADLWGQAVLPAWMTQLGAADVANNPYVSGMADALTSRVNRNFNENLLPGITTGAVGMGGFGTRDAVAQGVAAGQTSDVLSEHLANLYGGAYNTGLGASSAALGMSPMMASGQANLLQRAGEMEKFNQMEPYMRAQLGMGILGPLGQGFGTQQSSGTTTSTPSLFSSIGNLFGAGASLAGGFGGMGGMGMMPPPPQSGSPGYYGMDPYGPFSMYGY